MFLILPATALAVRSEQLATRRYEVARAEAVLGQQNAVRELKTAQVLLSSRTLDPALIGEGFERARRSSTATASAATSRGPTGRRCGSCRPTSRRPCGTSWAGRC